MRGVDDRFRYAAKQEFRDCSHAASPDDDQIGLLALADGENGLGRIAMLGDKMNLANASAFGALLCRIEYPTYQRVPGL
jgi:hypothetical protein